VRRNLSYNNDFNGMQFNGRVTNLVVEQNMFSSNLLSGLSFENGVAHSFVRSNLLFNNGRSGLTFAIYDYNGQDACAPITGQNCNCNNPNEAYCPNDENFNLIENNSFYNTGFDRTGAATTYGPISIGAQDASFPHDVGNNTFRNNIFYGGSGAVGSSGDSYPPVVYYDATTNWLSTSTFDHNIMLSLQGDSLVLAFGPGAGFGFHGYTCAQLASMTNLTSCINSNPQYAAASPSYYNSPGSFNFTPAVGSPVIGAGTPVGAPATDLWGTTRPSPPSIGAVEAVSGSRGMPPVSSGGPPSSGTVPTVSGSSGTPAISSVTCSPALLGGGATLNCTVVVSQAASGSGATVVLSTSTPSLSTPGSVIVPAGSSTATFTATVGTISSNGPAVITASLNASSQSASVKLLGCDLNGDGVVNNLDVQIAISQALGASPCSTSDLQNNSQCSVVDVQRVVGAALGGTCRIGQ
jgi:hypothetical protein